MTSDPVEKLLKQAQKALDVGNHQLALEYYDKSIEISPDNINVWYKRGMLLEQLGNITASGGTPQETTNFFREAKESLNKVIKLNVNAGYKYPILASSSWIALGRIAHHKYAPAGADDEFNEARKD